MNNDSGNGAATSVTSLVSGIVSDAQELIKQQAALIRAEVREELQKTKEAAILFAGGAVIALPALILVAFGVVFLLHWAIPTIPLWGWFLVVGAIACAASGAMIYSGVKKIQSFSPVPEQSIAALRENFQWRTNRT
jgi:hypothetical protein